MLALDPADIFNPKSIILKTLRNGVYSFSKSCAANDTVTFELYIEKTIGIYKPHLMLRDDYDYDYDYSTFNFNAAFIYDGQDGIYDKYVLTVKMSETVKTPSALLFYKIAFSVGDNTIYFYSRNNVDGMLSYSNSNENEFKMQVFESDFEPPKWFRKNVMYHIFVDRFCKDTEDTEALPVRSDAVINEDWYNGIPQYGNIPGDFCRNNMFFGGNLYGIAEKLEYLSSLGVGVIYLSPIFEAYSNHKYDTGDYSKVDAMFGGDKAFDNLISECNKLGIRIILDGVFNHTGDDSVYFNKYGRYGSDGAYRKSDSQYRDWYFFKQYPENYESWWGITVLPKLNTRNPAVCEYLAGENGIAAKYLLRGASGYRLDVADELPNEFLEQLRSTVKGKNPDAVIIGEVWENAVEKCAYGHRRSYFSGRQLDGVMNYPVRNAVVLFLKTGDAQILYDTVCDIYSSYPENVSLSLMNILGTHDTERILTVLATDRYIGMSGDELAHFKLTGDEYAVGAKRLLCASVLQYMLPGVPSLFYGDEAGISGGRDPFCRKTYPWGKEDKKLLEHYRFLGKLRTNEKALSDGNLEIIMSGGSIFAFSRSFGKEKITVAINACGNSVSLSVKLGENTQILYSSGCNCGYTPSPRFGEPNISLEGISFAVFKTI